MSRRAALLIARLAARLLPRRLDGWGRAMVAEAGAIDGRLAALGFAFGCLGCALRARMGFHLTTGDRTMMDMLGGRPRRLAMLCAAGATGLGLAWMAAAGAPLRHLAVNAVALILGILAVALLSRVRDVRRGVVDLMLAALLLLTALAGVSAGGVTRWVAVGGVLLQPSLLLVPILALRFASSRDALSTAAILVAALALALQPDRAMAGALAAAMAVLALLRPERNVLIALAAGGAGFAAALLRTDPSPAMLYVDQVFVSAFAVHALVGLAVAVGAVLLLVPAAIGLLRDPGNRAAYAVFGAIWLAAIAAALLGNYPTPLVGYGGSAILGYLVSLLGLPGRAEGIVAGRQGAERPADPEAPGDSLRAGSPLAQSA
ncbi:MAG TPA: hypothetical protein VMG08_18895 [Allosphingosinicella sp.]|nr:hypothetical protein [Allosphingosinicella sp.]